MRRKAGIKGNAKGQRKGDTGGMKAGSADYILNIRRYNYIPKPVHSKIILI